MEWTFGEYTLSDSQDKVVTETVYLLLQDTYWGVRRPREVIESMISHSLCFTLLKDKVQIGFGRAVTDYTVFTWLADIVIDERYRGQGLGKWMLGCMLEHPDIRDTHMVLQTRDAHKLYEKYGFTKNQALMSTQIDGL
ncbi:MAG: GNAT family N-acetyltransferase [Gammaproteobacteria bacterium]|nr:GNAT family N-acetyltransferase [Gammaproteobacteria bacterium]